MNANLFKSLSYKEWMKTKRCLLIILSILITTSLYSYIDMMYDIRINEAVNIWYAILFQGKTITPLMMYILPISTIMLALVQYVPEMIDKRLKLTLHLPAREINIILSMLLYGYVAIAIVFVIVYILVFALMSTILPIDIVWANMSQLLVWMFSSLITYSFTSWIILEPKWKQRILNIAVSLFLLSILYARVLPFYYSDFKTCIAILTISSFIFPIHSCIRFKEGIQ